MHTFFINGKQVTQREAYEHWLSSRTYQDAPKLTRFKIWLTALKGDASGNHNPRGEAERLAEAGVELR